MKEETKIEATVPNNHKHSNHDSKTISNRGLLINRYFTKPKAKMKQTFDFKYVKPNFEVRAAVIIPNTFKAVQILNFSHTKLTNFPTDIKLMPSVKSLCLDHNYIQTIPDIIKEFKGLKSLNLSYNELYEINKNLGTLKGLSSLNIDNNKLKNFPEWICNELSQLKLLSLHNNPKISKIPINFYNMKKLGQFSFDWLEYIMPEFGCILVQKDVEEILPIIFSFCYDIIKIKKKRFMSFLDFFHYLKQNPGNYQCVDQKLLVHKVCTA